MYSVGSKFRIDLFGSSHGECVGCIIEGLPRGMAVDTDLLEHRMALRRPSPGIGTARKEKDEVVFEHGVTDGKVSSDKVLLKIYNRDADGTAYSELYGIPRPGHADLPAMMRSGDLGMNGGGAFSGRMTAPLVAAGALAEQFLSSKGIEIAAYTKRIADVSDEDEHTFNDIRGSERFPTRAVTKELDDAMTERILSVSAEGDSTGGIVRCLVKGLPAGFGGMWFDALDVSVARMMFSVPGVKGVEFGKGFSLAGMRGSDSNDQYFVDDGRISAYTNNMGGVCGGMSDGMPLDFSVAFKPTPSISKEQHTVNIVSMRDETISVKGRHDPCIVPRVVSVVEAMAAVAVTDQYLSYGPRFNSQ